MGEDSPDSDRPSEDGSGEGTGIGEPGAGFGSSDHSSAATTPDESREVSLDDLPEEDDELLGASYGARAPAEQWPEAPIQRPASSGVPLEEISRADLRANYGLLRTFFKQRESEYRKFQRKLTQAWVRDTFDQYLAEVVRRMLGIAALGILLGIIAAAGLVTAAEYGLLTSVFQPLGLPIWQIAGLVGGTLAFGGVVAGGLYWVWRRIIRIQYRISTRHREINYTLPYAVTFMYALSHAGVSFDDIISRLGTATDTYGAAAQEFDRVVREVEMFGNNLYIGLENLRAVTPSEELRRLTDDLLTVLETGGNLSSFLRDEVDTQIETAIAEQEAFVERLELLSEIFVVGFVATPLFVIVVLMVISFLGAETLSILAALVYVIIPLSLVAFAVLIDVISKPFQQRATSLSSRDRMASPPSTGDDAPEWEAAYRSDQQSKGLRARVAAQITQVIEEPWRILLFTVPLTVLGLAVTVGTGAVPVSLSEVLDRPVAITTALVVVPLAMVTAPVAVIYEYRQRQLRSVQRRFPDLLDLLATSNRRGLSLTRGLDIIADSTTGRLSDELDRLRNDIRWNADVPGAFESFGDRLSSPALTQTAHLLAEGSRATSDLYVVLEVAATDTAERVKLERQRRENLQPYLVIIIIGFLVYLLVVLLLAANFLDPIEAFAAEAPTGTGGPVSLGAVPVSRLQVLLFHSALLQGFGSGVLAGKLGEGTLYAGLKYGLGLVLIAVVAFLIV